MISLYLFWFNKYPRNSSDPLNKQETPNKYSSNIEAKHSNNFSYMSPSFMIFKIKCRYGIVQTILDRFITKK